MAPPRDSPGGFATSEGPPAAPYEILPAAAPSEVLPAAAPSEVRGAASACRRPRPGDPTWRALCSTHRVPTRTPLCLGCTGQRPVIITVIYITEVASASAPGLVFYIPKVRQD
ncbi:uncharacterized protein C2845_PM11G06840 [Panicum miliaceum]|uniref:Uncharacterized protein n=1 Tax=Panicum miliaceum TaxID=4540 RepID=A0A3L6RT63_PANMI|nr:uncharacterized protein C2845_PM11G06840 [Panicum miliaceum]